MGIDVVWRDAAGGQRETVLDSSSVFSATIERLYEDPRHRHLLISTIDPYGDTRFSSGQASRLFREFEALRNAAVHPEERIVIGRVLSLLRAAEGAADEWLDFVGD